MERRVGVRNGQLLCHDFDAHWTTPSRRVAHKSFFRLSMMAVSNHRAALISSSRHRQWLGDTEPSHEPLGGQWLGAQTDAHKHADLFVRAWRKRVRDALFALRDAGAASSAYAHGKITVAEATNQTMRRVRRRCAVQQHNFSPIMPKNLSHHLSTPHSCAATKISTPVASNRRSHDASYTPMACLEAAFGSPGVLQSASPSHPLIHSPPVPRRPHPAITPPPPAPLPRLDHYRSSLSPPPPMHLQQISYLQHSTPQLQTHGCSNQHGHTHHHYHHHHQPKQQWWIAEEQKEEGEWNVGKGMGKTGIQQQEQYQQAVQEERRQEEVEVAYLQQLQQQGQLDEQQNQQHEESEQTAVLAYGFAPSRDLTVAVGQPAPVTVERCREVILLWHHNAGVAKMTIAMVVPVRNAMHQMLARWALAAALIARANAVVRAARSRHTRSVLRQALQQWVATAMVAMRAAAVLRVAATLHGRGSVRRALGQWVAVATLVLAAHVATALRLRSSAHQAFGEWASATMALPAAMRHSTAVLRRRLRSTLQEWAVSAASTRAMRASVEGGDTRARFLYLIFRWWQWRRAAGARHLRQWLLHGQRACQLAMELRWSQWRRVYAAQCMRRWLEENDAVRQKISAGELPV